MASQSALQARYHRQAQRRRARGAVWNVVRHVLLLLLCAYALAPLLWGLSASFKPPSELFTNPSLIPHSPTLSNYTYVVSQTKFLRWFWNTLLIAVSTTVLSVSIAMLGGYAMSRFRFWGRALYGNTLLVVQMFPGVMLAIPLFLIFTRLKLVDTYWSLLITYMSFALAFAVWMLKGYFDGIPREIEEAALIDGATPWIIVRRIFLPLLWPALVTTGLLAFVAAWNEFLFALTFTLTNEMRTVPVAIALMTGSSEYELPWGNIMAASVIVTLPVVVLVLIFQRKIVSGLTAGAVKG